MSVRLKKRVKVRDSEGGRYGSVAVYDPTSNVLTIEDGIVLYSTRGIETGDLDMDEDERKALNDAFAAIGDFVRVDEFLSSTDKWYTYYLVRATKGSMDAFRSFADEEGLAVDGSERAFSLGAEDRNKVCSFQDRGARLYRELGEHGFANIIFDLGGMDYERDGHRVGDSRSRVSRVKDGVGEFNWAEDAVYSAVLHELQRGSRSGYAEKTHIRAGRGNSGDAYTSYTGYIDLSCYFGVYSSGLSIDEVQFYPADLDSEETLDVWVDTYKVAEALMEDYPDLVGGSD